MNIIETYGKYVEQLSENKPETARKLLKTGWQAQNLKLKHMPDKRLLPADQYLAQFMMDRMLAPLKDPEHSVIVSIFTPCELMCAFGGESDNLNTMQQDFTYADEIAHANICGFGKTVLEAVLAGNVKELVLVNCCDTIRSVYDVLLDSGKLDFLYFLDILHSDGPCSIKRVSKELQRFAKAYGEYKGTAFDAVRFRNAFRKQEFAQEPYISILGARMGEELFQMVQSSIPYPVKNDTCVHNRSVGCSDMPIDSGFESLMDWYAAELLKQMPCMRMPDRTGRKELFNHPYLSGIIYHTVKFCDFYSFEYAQLKNQTALPLLKIESDYTIQSSGQLRTRLQAFAENMAPEIKMEKKQMGKGYFAGIDSGSASTDVVILNRTLPFPACVRCLPNRRWYP